MVTEANIVPSCKEREITTSRSDQENIHNIGAKCPPRMSGFCVGGEEVRGGEGTVLAEHIEL